MNEANAQVKQQKREARQLWDQARQSIAAGDYRTACGLDEKVLEIAGETDPGPKARKEISDLKLDRWVLYGGISAVALYALAWIYALSG
jgi:hypothetical protein